MKTKTPENPWSKRQLLFATVPYELLLPPAIRRGNEDEWRLRPFEFAIAMAAIGLARSVLEEQRHLEALQAGAASIAQEKEYEKRYRDDWRKSDKYVKPGEMPLRLVAYTPLI
jgi:hypothetical protein